MFGDENFRFGARAVKRTPRSQLYVGYGVDSGPSRGDSCTRAFRPKRSITCVAANVRLAQEADNRRRLTERVNSTLSGP
jgi:hypothetical protein